MNCAENSLSEFSVVNLLLIFPPLSDNRAPENFGVWHVRYLR